MEACKRSIRKVSIDQDCEYVTTLAKLYDEGWPTFRHVHLENQEGV